MNMAAIVEIKDLKKIYRGRMQTLTALNNVSLKIEKGSFTALIGKSGSGKSTLLNCIAGLIPFDDGSIIISKTELNKMNEEQRAEFRCHNLGIVQQFFCLIAELTVHDNLMIPFDLNDEKREEKYVEELLRQLELFDVEERFPFELSGGQQQRVAIARALSRKPSLVLADEPTGNLDRQSGHQVIRLLKKAQAYFDQTVIFATHDLELAKYADQIFLIEDGQVTPYE
ncbi:hypothetical protein C815_01843 [Firmicutes bacterium M10-2]|nr:hypothetical protein C815_01843 [Firmicutes bacterium M10-2]